MILFICIIIIVITLLHLKYYLRNSLGYEIFQINNNIYKMNDYYKKKIPIIFSIKHKNFKIFNLLCPLTIKKKYLKYNSLYMNYFTHKYDKLFIIANDKIIIDLINPSNTNSFNKLKRNKEDIILLNKKNNNFNYIQIILNKNDILYIPNIWIIKLNKNNFTILNSHNIFSIIFKNFI